MCREIECETKIEIERPARCSLFSVTSKPMENQAMVSLLLGLAILAVVDGNSEGNLYSTFQTFFPETVLSNLELSKARLV